MEFAVWSYDDFHLQEQRPLLDMMSWTSSSRVLNASRFSIVWLCVSSLAMNSPSRFVPQAATSSSLASFSVPTENTGRLPGLQVRPYSTTTAQNIKIGSSRRSYILEPFIAPPYQHLSLILLASTRGSILGRLPNR